MRWKILAMAVLAAAGILAEAQGCKRQEVKPQPVTRPANMAPPSTQDVAQAKQQKAVADFEPIPPMLEGVNEQTPDGEVWTKFPSGLMIHDLLLGDGVSPRLGQTVSVAYKGMFPSADPAKATVFDQSKRDSPLTFQLGSKSMIRGFSQGIATMKVGGKRRIYVPAELGYGAAGKGGTIPPNQPLIFEVELLSVSGESLEPLVPVVPKAEPAGPPAPASVPATRG